MTEPLPGSSTVVCPRCGTPVRPNTPFCDHCGARVTPPPACTLCGTLLEPNSRFCPSCGTMIGASKNPREEHSSPGEERSGSAGSDEPPAVPKPRPKNSWWRRRAGLTVPPGVRALCHPRALVSRYGGAILIAAALLLILAGIFAFSGSGYLTPATTLAVITPSGTVPVTVAETQGAPRLTGKAVTAENISLVPGAVDQVPQNLRIFLEITRDPRSHVVSVAFRGGEGQLGVQEIVVRLTRSDGTILTGSFRPVQSGSSVELQGTEKVDRVEVTARYFSGDEYKIADQIFEYKIRT